MKTFRVVSIDADGENGNAHIVRAATPESAAASGLGLDVVRGASKRAKPVAKVYWQDGPHQTNMVRLYARISDASGRASDQTRVRGMIAGVSTKASDHGGRG